MDNSTIVKQDGITEEYMADCEVQKLNTPNTKSEAFRLDYRIDGVYLTVYPPKNSGEKMNKLEIIEAIKRKKIEAPKLEVISALIANEQLAEEKIAEAQKEMILDEEVAVQLSEDHMEVFLTLYPPDEKGSRLEVAEMEAILQERYHVVYGIDREILEMICRERPYKEPVLVASGVAPQAGKNGSVSYYFATNDKADQFMSDETEKIDFRNISKFESIEEGQVLVNREFATSGTDGMNVLGKRLVAVKGKEAACPKAGKNVRLSEDRTELLSLIKGKASIIDGKVVVLPHIKINSDVDMSVGNVSFDGDIVISGNVNPGFTVSATGNILVTGSVEAATLQAEGNITIQGGVKGADKSEIAAGGTVSAPFVERATITTGQNLITGMLVNSNVICEGHVDVSQGRGTLVGGSISAGKYVVGRVIGSDVGIPTKISIGALAHKRLRVAELEKEVIKLDSNINRLELASKNQLSHINEKAKLDLVVASLKLKSEKNKLLEEKGSLEEEILQAKAGNVHALDKIYKGVKLYFGKDAYSVPYDNEYVTYSKKQKEILTEACRYVKNE